MADNMLNIVDGMVTPKRSLSKLEDIFFSRRLLSDLGTVPGNRTSMGRQREIPT